MPKCLGITLKGNKCQRSVKSGLYCHQHVKPMGPMDSDVKKLLNATRKGMPRFDILRSFQYKCGMINVKSKTVYEHEDFLPFEVDLKDECGSTSLLYACEYEFFNIAKLLIEAGADVNVNVTGQYGSTSLIWASIRGNVEIVKLLVERGADINDSDDYGGTALIAAAGCNRLDIVKFLLENDADINCETDGGITALIAAVECNEPDIVKFLLENDADIVGLLWYRCSNFSSLPYNEEIVKIISEHTPDSKELINASKNG